MPTNPQDVATLIDALIIAVIVLIFVLIICLTQIGVRAQRRFEQWKSARASRREAGTRSPIPSLETRTEPHTRR